MAVTDPLILFPGLRCVFSFKIIGGEVGGITTADRGGSGSAFFIFGIFFSRFLNLAAEARVEEVSQGVSQDVEGKNRDHDHQAGERGNPGSDAQDFAALVDNGAPGGVRWLHAQAEVAQARLDEDSRGDV